MTRVRVGGTVHDGPAVAVEGVDPRQVADAVAAAGPVGEPPVAVDCEPGPLHGYVGAVHGGMGLRLRTALAAAARTRGLDTPHDDAIGTVRERLAAAVEPDGVETTAAQRRAAAGGEEVRRLRERVAAARGRVEAGGEGAREALVAAIRELSEAETRAEAARERLERARAEARRARDQMAERRRLQDRLANLERAARSSLVEQVRPAYAEAVRAVPGTDAGEAEDPFDAPPVTAALAVVRVGDPSAPVALGADAVPFGGAGEARAWLDAPVVYIG